MVTMRYAVGHISQVVTRVAHPTSHSRTLQIIGEDVGLGLPLFGSTIYPSTSALGAPTIYSLPLGHDPRPLVFPVSLFCEPLDIVVETSQLRCSISLTGWFGRTLTITMDAKGGTVCLASAEISDRSILSHEQAHCHIELAVLDFVACCSEAIPIEEQVASRGIVTGGLSHLLFWCGILHRLIARINIESSEVQDWTACLKAAALGFLPQMTVESFVDLQRSDPQYLDRLSGSSDFGGVGHETPAHEG